MVHNIIGHVCKGVKEPALSRVFEYWRNVDHDLGTKVEEGSGLNNLAFATEPQPGMIETHDGVDVSKV